MPIMTTPPNLSKTGALKGNAFKDEHTNTHSGTHHPSFWLSLWNWCAPKPVSFPCIMPQGERLWMVVAATHYISCGSGCRGKHTHTHAHTLKHTLMIGKMRANLGAQTHNFREETHFWGPCILFHTQPHTIAGTQFFLSLPLTHTHKRARTHTQTQGHTGTWTHL